MQIPKSWIEVSLVFVKKKKNALYVSEPTCLGRFNGNRGTLTHDLLIVGVLAVFCVKPASFTPPAPFLMKGEETVWTKVAFKSGVLGSWPGRRWFSATSKCFEASYTVISWCV